METCSWHRLLLLLIHNILPHTNIATQLGHQPPATQPMELIIIVEIPAPKLIGSRGVKFNKLYIVLPSNEPAGIAWGCERCLPLVTFWYLWIGYLWLPFLTFPYHSLHFLTFPYLSLPFLSFPFLTFHHLHQHKRPGPVSADALMQTGDHGRFQLHLFICFWSSSS